MKAALLGLSALMVLGAGAFHPAKAASGEVAKTKHAAEGEAGPALSFVEMDPMILPIIDENGVSQVVSLVVVIEAADEAAAAEIEKFSPRLKDAYIQDMYGVLSREAAMRGGVLQVGLIKERLNRISARVMGENKVNDVLLQVVSQRRI